MIRKTYHLTDQQYDRLRVLSQQTGVSVAELLRRAVDEYLERRPAKAE
jgi:predicted DNA-binding protein